MYKALNKTAEYLLKRSESSQAGARNNNWKGDSAGYSAKHKRGANGTGNNQRGSKCVNCGATTNLQYATIHGTNGTQHKTLCASCHAKYDNKANNINNK